MRVFLPLFLFSLVLFVVVVCMEQAEVDTEPDLDPKKDLESWSRLKRDAGYFTESGQYRGGLYTHAIDEGCESYECDENTTNYCIRWKRERYQGDKSDEDSTCQCDENEMNYCKAWSCEHSQTSSCRRNATEVCDTKPQIAKKDCSCTQQAKNDKYCLEWSCTQVSYNGDFEKQNFNCLNDEIEEYCSRWKGRTSSKEDIKSVVCQCNSSRGSFCASWLCCTREITICEAHSGWWCNYWVAVLCGGGFGVFIIVAFSTFSLLMEEPHMALPLSLLALLLLVGVVLWGGVRALPLVAALWFFALLLPLWITICQPSRERNARFGRMGRSKEPDLF